MVVHPIFFLLVLAGDCAVAPQSPLFFHLSSVLLFSCSLQACPVELDICLSGMYVACRCLLCSLTREPWLL